MAYSPSLSNRPPLFTPSTVTSTSVSFPPSSVKISFVSFPCLRTRPRLPNSYTVPQFRVTCSVGIAEINETQFSDTVLKADRPVLVEFVATWCGPCRLISPIMEWAAQVTKILMESMRMVSRCQIDLEKGLDHLFKIRALREQFS